VQGAAGTGYATYLLRNAGDAPCTLFGYPGVSVLDSRGRMIGIPATRIAGSPRQITLPQGGSAAFQVTSNAVACSGSSSSSPDDGRQLRVYPPNNTAALTLRGYFTACELRVGPVRSA